MDDAATDWLGQFEILSLEDRGQDRFEVIRLSTVFQAQFRLVVPAGMHADQRVAGDGLNISSVTMCDSENSAKSGLANCLFRGA